MRNAEDVYWSTSLPKDHQALQALDDYRREWGGLSRAEATRHLLIEWDKLRRGESTVAWPHPNVSSQTRAGGPEQTPQGVEASTSPRSNRVAKAASRDLDY